MPRSIALGWPAIQDRFHPVQSGLLTERGSTLLLAQARHVAEISTISEYISILDGHATQLRAEIQSLGDQAQSARDDKLAKTQQREAANPRPVPKSQAIRKSGFRTCSGIDGTFEVPASQRCPLSGYAHY